MGRKTSEEKADEYASLLRQGAGNYSSLCGVLAGFVMVIVALFVTSEPLITATGWAFELGVVLLAVASFGYILAALGFISISSTPLSYYKTTKEMHKEYAFNQALVMVFTSCFLGAVAFLTFSVGSMLMAITTAAGCILATSYLIRDWWALARRQPPKKKT